MCSNGKMELIDNAKGKPVTLTQNQLQRLIVLCSDLVKLCGEVAGGVDPAAGRLIEYVGEEIAELLKARVPED